MKQGSSHPVWTLIILLCAVIAGCGGEDKNVEGTRSALGLRQTEVALSLTEIAIASPQAFISTPSSVVSPMPEALALTPTPARYLTPTPTAIAIPTSCAEAIELGKELH